MTTYDHIQRSPLYLILLAPVLAIAIAAMFVPVNATLAVFWSCMIPVFIVAAFSFKRLRVRDEGDCLAIRFGPLPIFRRLIPYSQITAAEAGRSTILHGWGIHYWGSGWIYNLWGFDCVVVHLGTRVVRIGTDDVQGLLSFLNEKIPPTHAQNHRA